ncbi:hypothetical protein [Flavobacterium sp. ALD4]|uniref:hypothetical protein n=1 Tax=Flavobacterium sp. ALD4 TaxID=2058314 RepID=UPI0012FEA4A2|nr:hypothetical protein [Flavobacterium sp. ALD4]
MIIEAQILQINENHKLLKKFNNYLAKNISMLVCLPQAEMKAFRSQFRGQRNVEFFLFRLTNFYRFTGFCPDPIAASVFPLISHQKLLNKKNFSRP